MKDVMIDIMVNMMPLMKPFMWLGIAAAILGFTFVVAKLALNKHNSKAIVWSARIVFSIAIFFMAAQIAGHFLSMPPTINFGDSSKFEFILVSFWQIGVAFLVSALIIKFVGASNKLEHS